MTEEGFPACKKLDMKGNVDVNVDRISKLPDKVIQHILNSLQTKQAVRTSLLSRSWRYRWMSVTDIRLSEWEPDMSPKRAWFFDFVDSVFAFREPSDLDVVALAFNLLRDASRINSWLCSAVKHNVQRLFLLLDQIDDEETLELPHCLFTCYTLRTINITAEVLLKLPSAIQLFNLKILTLCNVIFPEDESTQRLFSGLPVLEELTLDKCSWWNVKNITISLPMLRKLDITETVADPDSCRIYIIAENLRSFVYVGVLRNNYCIYDSVSLSSGILALCRDLEGSDRHREVSFRADMLLRGISSVKELTLTSYAFEALTYSAELFSCIPVLYKLTSLGFLPLGNSIDFGCRTARTLAKFLQKVPYLEELIFRSGVNISGNHEGGNWILDPLPSCFSSHLKKIKMFQFCGTERELLVVKSLLKSAKSLLQMDITCLHEKFSGGSARERSVLNELKMFPRASTSCKISFS